MELGIIGLAQSGKTTLFQALTRGRAEVARAAGSAPPMGVVKVPDERLASLEALFHPKRTIPAEIKYSDVAAATSQDKVAGWSGQLLAHLSQEDAFIAVIRAFRDDRIPHPLRTEYRSPLRSESPDRSGQGGQGSVDPVRDLATIEMELAFSDLAILERRLDRLGISLKAAKPGEREAHLREQALLARIKMNLEKDIPLREQALSPEEAKMLEGYQFLTAKPLLAAFNIGEAELPQASSLETGWRERLRKPLFGLVALCARLEMELSQLTEAEARDFRSALGAVEPAVDRLVRLSYRLLGLITFFTVVSGEVKAWTIRQGTPAVKAAGKIHSDMERGFIRAEVVSYADLMKAGSLAEARKHGLLRAEGKTYEVRDGDVITFLFNV